MLFKTGILLVVIANVWCHNFFAYNQDNIGTLDADFFESVKDKSKISILDLRGAGIVRVLDTALQGFDNIFRVTLGTNFIECFPEDVFQGIQNVAELAINTNRLRHLPKNIFSKLRKLINLDIKNNLLNKLEVGLFDNNVAIKEIVLENNRLTHIPDGTFSKLNNLKTLQLGSNYIHHIDRNAMPSAVPTNLETLWLYGNKLQSVVLYENVLKSLKIVNFDGNPLYCDCFLKPLFKRWLETFRHTGWEPTCGGPEDLKHRGWSSLQLSDFVCERNVVSFSLETGQFPGVDERVVLACRINIPVGDIAITYNNGTNVVDHLRRQRRFPSVQTDSSDEHSWYKLTIKDLKAQDAGTYRCVINGKVEREYYLTIDDPSYYEKCAANVYFPVNG